MRLQTSEIYNFSHILRRRLTGGIYSDGKTLIGDDSLRFGLSLPATGLASLRQKLDFILYITEFGSQLNMRQYVMDAHALATNVLGACMRWILAGRSVDRWHASIIVGEVCPTDSSLSTPNHL